MSAWTDAINAYYEAYNRHRGTVKKVAEAEEALEAAKRVEELAYVEVITTHLKAVKEIP